MSLYFITSVSRSESRASFLNFTIHRAPQFLCFVLCEDKLCRSRPWVKTNNLHFIIMCPLVFCCVFLGKLPVTDKHKGRKTNYWTKTVWSQDSTVRYCNNSMSRKTVTFAELCILTQKSFANPTANPIRIIRKTSDQNSKGIFLRAIKDKDSW